MFCVKKIPEKYILDRWKKNIKGYEDVDNVRSFDKYGDTSSSAWRLQMMRKFTTLITASATNPKTRVLCEELFQKAREAVEMEIGPTYHSGAEDNVNSGGIVRDPNRLREKGQKNKRKVSIAKRKANLVKTRKKSIERQATNSFSPLAISPIVSTTQVYIILKPLVILPLSTKYN